jgi:hypothetical protein
METVLASLALEANSSHVLVRIIRGSVEDMIIGDPFKPIKTPLAIINNALIIVNVDTTFCLALVNRFFLAI